MFSSMNRHLLLTLLALSGGSLSHATPVIFNVNEIDLGTDYKIAGGTIEVSMDLSTITDFTVEIAGPHPYSFSSTKATPDVLENGSLFDITSDSVGLVFDIANPSGPRFTGEDPSVPSCVNSPAPGMVCSQRLFILRDNMNFRYEHENVLGVVVSANQSVPAGRLEFATAVPEPSSAMFLSFILLGGAGTRWWRVRQSFLAM